MLHTPAGAAIQDKMSGPAFPILLGSMFLLFGVVFGILPMAKMGFEAWSSRHWQAVPATVVDIEYQRHDRAPPKVVIHYRYVYAGKTYVSDRMGLGWGYENFGNWRDPWHERAVAARAGGAPLTAWVDPRQPERAVLERALRWGRVQFDALFVLPAVAGLGFLVHALRPPRPARPVPATLLPSSATEPKLPALLMSGLFVVVLGGGGAWFGVLPILDTAVNAARSKHWQPVPGTVLAAYTNRRSSTRATVHYRYEFAGRTYQSERIGLGWHWPDHVGTWNRKMYELARDAEATRQPVTVWVDPQLPHRSVLDRSLRWGVLTIHLLFSLPFLAMGLGGAWVFGYVLLKHGGTVDGATSGEMARRMGKWIVTGLWCLLSGPLAVMAWLEPFSSVARVFIWQFAFVGLGLVWWMAHGMRLRSS